MITVGMIVGIFLVVVGVIILVKFPDRPGGTIKLRGIEISSKGAGLPIIFLGVICIIHGVGAYRSIYIPPLKGCQSRESNVIDKCLGSVPQDTIVNIEEGRHNKEFISPDKLNKRILNIKLEEDGNAIGAMQVTFFPEDYMFKIKSIIDNECQEINNYKNVTHGAPHNVIQNWDTVEMQFGNKKYAIQLGYSAGQIQANYFERISP